MSASPRILLVGERSLLCNNTPTNLSRRQCDSTEISWLKSVLLSRKRSNLVQ